MNNPVILKVVEQMETLPDDLQQQVLEYVQTLKASGQSGVPGRRLLRFAGFIPSDDLQEMKQAIATGCEQVDLNDR
jgi:hypothetical protein